VSGDVIVWSPGVKLETIERQVIEKAFRFYKENKTATASALGISVRTLDNKFAQYTEQDKTMTERGNVRRQDRDTWLARARGLAPVPQHNSPRQAVSAEAGGGVRVEPATATSAELAVSVHERPKVQDVLPTKAVAGGHGKRR
jgi:hypothetical protein